MYRGEQDRDYPYYYCQFYVGIMLISGVQHCIILNYTRNIINSQMDMQKIMNNIKHKHRDFNVRLDYSMELERVALKVRESQLPQDESLLALLVLENQSNFRQKMKIYKRTLESNDKKDEIARAFLAHYLRDLHLKEYIFGNTESKSILMNTLKRINQLEQISMKQIVEAVNDITIEEYQQCRNVLEILDVLIRNGNQLQLKQSQKEINPIIEIILSQFVKGKATIIQDTFKLKWLEYFVDVLRSMNNVVRIFGQVIERTVWKQIMENIRELSNQHKILTKQVLTQMYLLLLQINPAEQPPNQENKVCLIHYLHAKNVILGEDNLAALMKLLSTLKQTEHKCQLVPILLKAFQSYYNNYQDKANVFDTVVSLFQIGRSIYAYLQEIIGIIMKYPDSNWNLEGNYLRKFFIATVVLKQGCATSVIMDQWPTVIEDVIVQAGGMTIPYASDCAQILLTRLYEQSNKDYGKWAEKWMPDYKKCLLSSNNRTHIRGIVEFINPILLSVNPEPLLLRQILEMNNSNNKEESILIGIISLLKCFKQLGKIVINNEKGEFNHTQDKTITFNKQQIKDMLLSNDSTISLKALQFVTVHLKSAQPMEPLQLQLALQFYRSSLKTSLPQYRKSYLNATKKMLQRLRTVYQNELTKSEIQLKKNKRYKPRQYFSEFKAFLQNLISICYQSVFPDVIFELASPALEILLLVGTYFNRDRIQVKKGQIFQPCHILRQTTYFDHRNFENLLCCLQSSYESVRILTHKILQLFYDLSNVEQIKQLWRQSLSNANKLTIKSYQYACRILAFISQIYPHLLQLPSKYAIKQLNICQYFFNIVQERYVVFKEQFATQEESYYRNLIHGILTVFSYTFDNLADKIRSEPLKFQPHFSQIKQFLKLFFEQMNQIILFSVEICSSNISTVVLDSLPQSQTDKKYKVDCRGHFLEQSSKNVGSFFESTALLTSMQNQEQGIENMLVVSFYLLTREAGLVFQSIGNLVGTIHSSQYIPNEPLVQLVNTYFYALINLKHMGSVDRISGGLAKMAKVIFDNEDTQLSLLPQKLLQKLLTNLKLGNFTNILRRSAGVPYAFTCLLKSQALRRKQMIERTITTLLQLSKEQQQPSVELRIHSLNILKKLFQDGDLKAELDPYVSIAFMSSIKGFTSEEWGVRNSSLMLFSVLANRTVGIKPTYNLLQFFHKCPQLLSFFTEQLQSMKLNTMYPPLYPIVLLLSRLLPFDLKQKAKLSNKGDMNMKQIRKDKLLELLPLIEKTGLNNNHMGRVMAAKAILPFMQINNIIPYCLQRLENISKITCNNLVHYNLVTVYQLLLSLRQIANEQKYELKIEELVGNKIENVIFELSKLINRKQSLVVTQVIIKIIHHFLENYGKHLQHSSTYSSLVGNVLKTTKPILEQYFKYPNLIIPMNMGNSVAVKQCLNLHNQLLSKYQPKSDFEEYNQFLLFLKSQIQNNPLYLQIADTQVIEYYLQCISSDLKENKISSKLEKQIEQVINKIDMKCIASDNILIEIFTFRTFLKIPLSPQLLLYINQLQSRTNNHFLKISIFKYIESCDKQHPAITPLLQKYSKPQQLQQLRQCCVQYIQNYPKYQSNHSIIYIRLLQDEQIQIRLETAKILAQKLGVSQMNEQVIKNIILSSLSLSEFGELLTEASDYSIKLKNNEQERIFSYDKPNKYRSDISNIIYCLLNNLNLSKNKEELSKSIEFIFQKINLPWQKQTYCVDKYIKDIINRNEYQFQTILRLFLMHKSELKERMDSIFRTHPLLEKVYTLYN